MVIRFLLQLNQDGHAEHRCKDILQEQNEMVQIKSATDKLHEYQHFM